MNFGKDIRNCNHFKNEVSKFINVEGVILGNKELVLLKLVVINQHPQITRRCTPLLENGVYEETSRVTTITENFINN